MSPANARRSADLPEPDRPSSRTTSPGSIESETSSSAGEAAPGYVNVTLFACARATEPPAQPEPPPRRGRLDPEPSTPGVVPGSAPACRTRGPPSPPQR